MRIRRWLPAATVITAAVLGTPAPAMSATSTDPADAVAPHAAEDGAYPNRSDILAATGADLIAGDGNITQTSCSSGSYQIMVWARNLLTDESRICFRAANTGYLSVNIPRAYRIETDDRDIKASISIEGTTENLTVPRDTAKGFGEANLADPKQAVLLDIEVTGSAAHPPTGSQPADAAGLAFNGKLTIGDKGRTCSAALVDPYWVVTARSCFDFQIPSGDLDPGPGLPYIGGPPKLPTTVTVGRTDQNATGGFTTQVVHVWPRSDRGLVLARLAAPATGISPITLAATAPTAGEELTAAGFGRTRTEWVPTRLHSATLTAGAPAPTGFPTDVKSPTDAVVCKGDAGGPVWRIENSKPALAGVITHAWQGGCLGAPVDETRTGSYTTRTDDLADWLQEARSTNPGWKTTVLVNGDNSVRRAMRLADGTYTSFADLESEASNIGGVKAFTAAGINDDTHIVALGGDGRVHHTIAHPRTGLIVRDGDGISYFGEVNTTGLTSITQVSAVSIGLDLHVLAVANGRVYHAIRHNNGTWTSFGDVLNATGNLPAVTSITAASTGGQLQVAVVAGGKVYHAIRNTTGSWTNWGDITQAAGATGAVTAVTMAGAGNDAHLAVITDNGTRQLHTIRYGNGTWNKFGSLAGVWGQLTATSISGTVIGGELQLAVSTSDNRALLAIRRTDGVWPSVTPIDLKIIPGSHNRVALTGTFLR